MNRFDAKVFLRGNRQIGIFLLKRVERVCRPRPQIKNSCLTRMRNLGARELITIDDAIDRIGAANRRYFAFYGAERCEPQKNERQRLSRVDLSRTATQSDDDENQYCEETRDKERRVSARRNGTFKRQPTCLR